MDENFLLMSDVARDLYHNHAARLPIIDYHCHLNPRMVADDYRFKSITELWLGGDHYKWRAMRANGVSEHFITGDASDYEKFEKWAQTVPYAMRNPLYHWTHLELRTAFGINKLLNPSTAREIYEECNDKLRRPEYSARNLMRRYHVEAVCTTDDPADSLDAHIAARQSGFEIQMLPAWRPDKALNTEQPQAFKSYVEKLEILTNRTASHFPDFIDLLQQRHNFFAEQGCRISDHGLAEFYAEDFTDAEIEAAYEKLCRGENISSKQSKQFKSAMLLALARMDAQSGWTQQFHYGTIRNANTKMMQLIGPDTGYDSIGEYPVANSLARFLDRLNSLGILPKTILYNINPAANEMLASMAGNFQDGTVPGKIQFGAAWWFNDHKAGIENQINTLSAFGLLSRFVGMLTDSRSFLSYARHEYFRRILCNLIGNDVERGELPSEEMPRIQGMVEDICYYNAKNYFCF